MALILNIDTATENASVCITESGKPISILQNKIQKDHASFVHLAIDTVLTDCNKTLQDIDAFAVSAGPGSYTGLRVGLATVKGFCYALSKPLIMVGTLEAMTIAAIRAVGRSDETLFCPMVDARRLEVFTAVYDNKMQPRILPASKILVEGSFEILLQNQQVVFFGNGSIKYKEIEKSTNASFLDVIYSAEHVGLLADERFRFNNFSDISYSEPLYLKEFYSISKN